jgi:hypothetical protein
MDANPVDIMQATESDRAPLVRRGLRLNYLTIA